MNTAGCVYLVGAGCGEADLITMRGLRLLKQCNVLVYDDLIDSSLLSETPDSTEKIYVGKRSGKHAMPQSEINQLLVEQAQQGKTVVRLKGGDPFVFGRGGEEVLALQAHGIPYETVPGISSAIAIPAAAGIPVTHRGLSQSVHIVTGHTAGSKDGLPADLDKLAQLSGTLVFLMGLAQLPQIVQHLIAGGKKPDTPAAVISGGNAPHPITVRGTLLDIVEKVRHAQVQAPAVIVVGDAAVLDLSPAPPRPLSGVKVAVTGTALIRGKLAKLLREQGAAVLTAGNSQLRPLPCTFDLSRLTDGNPHWLVFTSGNGVHCFFDVLQKQRLDLRALYRCRFAVIGAATAAVLRGYGVSADLCPQRYTCQDLAQSLCSAAEPIETVFLFRSARGSKALSDALTGRYTVEDVPLYDLTAEAVPQPKPTDYIAFSSSSGVDLYFAQNKAIPEHTICVCIGEVTAGMLRRYHQGPILLAKEISADGIVQTILADHASST